MAAAPACVLCKYFITVPGVGIEGGGICRRHPPVAIVTPKGLTSTFPYVSPVNWCGEGVAGEAPPEVKIKTEPLPKGLIQ